MAEPLFLKLFKYRQSEKRTPTEDFLTEILTDWLSRLSPELRRDFTASCFVPETLRDRFRAMVGTNDLEIRCQVSIANRKSLDMLISSGGLPLIAIESKIAARFQSHRRDTDTPDLESTSEEYDHQLQTYGRWLASQPMPDGWPGVITLLTHISMPPADFEPFNREGYGAVPHTFFWRTLCARVGNAIGPAINSADEPPWKFIGRELCHFLETNDMNATDLEASEIAAMNVSMAPARRTTELFAEVGADLAQRYPDDINARRRGSGYEVENSRAWGWSYLKGDGDIYVAYGIYFYPFAGHLVELGPAAPPHEQAFIGVGSDKVALPSGQTLPTTSWLGVAENWLVIHPIALSERLTGERLPQFFLRSIDKRMSDVQLLADLFRNGLAV